MGRFLNLAQGTEATPERQEVLAGGQAVTAEPGLSSAAERAQVASFAREEPASLLHWVGLLALCLYLPVGLITELSLRLFGGHLYLSIVAMSVMLVAFLLSGGFLRTINTRVGKLWWALLVWMIVAAPFSYWKSGTLAMLINYVPRAHFLLFFVCAFVVNLRQVHFLMRCQGALGYLYLIWCFAFGKIDPVTGRFAIPDSMFLANANDLAIQLLVSSGAFFYLASQKSLVSRMFGFAGLPVALYYVLRTGSRGTFLAAVVVFLLISYYSRPAVRGMLAAIAGITLAVALLTVPGQTLRRLTLIFLDPGSAAASGRVTSEQEASSVASQMQRWALLKLSVWYTITNPVFGVGQGQFINKVGGDAIAEGERSSWLGTHNMYTQISSECGIPAAALFISVLWLSIRSMIRLLKLSRMRGSTGPFESVAFSLLAMLVGFGVSGMFHHLAYSQFLPLLAGQAAALEMVAGPYSQERQIVS
jgi:hypothetical protein